MSLDLNDLLANWPHEPGQLTVRKIMGSDSREKLQLRIDLGVIQMEITGRPDGTRPHDCESLLEYHQRRAALAESRGEKYTLDAEEVGDLQQEGIQYYHRYISFFQLEEFAPVVRDTLRNLEMFQFVAEHAESEDLAEAVVQFTPYVLMMHTRALAATELARGAFETSAEIIEDGLLKIRRFYEDQENAEGMEQSAEISFLTEWLDEVRAKQPLSEMESMRRDLQRAIAAEAYEKAAQLRDAIKAYADKNPKGE